MNNYIVGKIEKSNYDNNRSFRLGDMKNLVKAIINLNRLSDHINDIENGTNNIVVKYDQSRSTDQLHRGRFSHDTLLLYFRKLIDNKPMLKRKIVNKYPYVLVDEYQDTSKVVIESFLELKNYSDLNIINYVLALLGDPSQSIYNDGIGDLEETVEEYNSSKADEANKIVKLEKRYNRRSRQEIISLSNKFRYDKSEKETIYQDFNRGKIFFEQMDSSVYTKEEYTNLINRVAEEIGTDVTVSDLNILVTRNSFIASFYKFDVFYEKLRSFPKYSGANYNELNNKFFNRDKFEKDLELIWNLAKLYSGFVKSDKLSNVIPLKHIKDRDLTVEDIVNMREFIIDSIDINNLSLEKWIKKIYELKNKNLLESQDESWSKLLDLIISTNLNFKEYDEFKFDLYNSLSSFSSYGDSYSIVIELQNRINIDYGDDMEEQVGDIVNTFEEDNLELVYSLLRDVDSKMKLIEYIKLKLNAGENLDIISDSIGESLDELYSVDISEYYNWYKYISEISTEITHRISTLHGSKGKTLKNVLLIVNKGYKSNSREYESNFMKLINGVDVSSFNQKEKECLNLLYVAISRAVDNIYIVYNDPFEKVDELRSIFIN